MWRWMERHAIWSPLLLILTFWFLSGCSSGNLPEPARVALNESIVRLSGVEQDYRVVSAQKAPGPPADFRIDTTSTHQAGRCPPNLGGEETWCVVIDHSITDSTGRTFSRFLVTREGTFWEAEALADSDAGVFEYFGCSNWDVTD